MVQVLPSMYSMHNKTLIYHRKSTIILDSFQMSIAWRIPPRIKTLNVPEIRGNTTNLKRCPFLSTTHSNLIEDGTS